MVNELFNYLESFIIGSEWNNGNTAEQARAMFTTICFVGNVDADTAKCDNMLLCLYNECNMEDVVGYDEFEMFMVELIV